MKDDDILAYLWADGEWISEESADFSGFPSDKSDDYITVLGSTPISDIQGWIGKKQATIFLNEVLLDE